MATIIVSPSGAGSGDGSTSGNAMSIANASNPVAGNTYQLMNGNYPAWTVNNGGTSGAHVTYTNFSGSTPIIEGGVQIPSGNFSASPLGTNGGLQIYRATVGGLANANIGGVIWLNDFAAASGTGVATGSAGVMGRNCTPQMMTQLSSHNDAAINPNLAIHTYTSIPATGWWGQPLYTNKYQAAISDSAHTLDICFNGDAPSGYAIWYGANGGAYGLTLGSVSYIDFSNIYFRHWKYWVSINGSSNITFNNCNFRYAFGSAGFSVSNATNITVQNSLCVGVGNTLQTFQDMVVTGPGVNGLKFDSNTMLYVGHDGFYIQQGAVSNLTITNNEIGFCDSGINFTSSVSGSGTTPTGPTAGANIGNNYIHDCGIPVSQVGGTYTPCALWDGAIFHMGMEISSLMDSNIHHNVFYNCATGIHCSGAANKYVARNRFYHNHFIAGPVSVSNNNGTGVGGCAWAIDCTTDSPNNNPTIGRPALENNQFIDNIFSWAGAFSTFPGGSGGHVCCVLWNVFNDGNGSPFSGSVFDHNHFYALAGGANNNIIFSRLGSASKDYTTVTSLQADFPSNCTNNNPGGGSGTVGGSSPVFLSAYTGAAVQAKNDFQLQGSSPCKAQAVAVSGDPVSPDADIGNTVWSGVTNTGPSGAVISPGSQSGTSPFILSFSGSYQPGNGSAYTFAWTFAGGNVTTSTLQNPGAVTFTTVGTHAVTFSVTDNNNLTSTAAPVTITVTAAGGGNGTSTLNPITNAATASSTDTTTAGLGGPGPPYSAAYAFDADATSQWVKDASIAYAGNPAWAKIDLTGSTGVYKDIDQIQIMFRKYDVRSYNYSVLTSQDDQTYTTWVTTQDSGVGTQWSTNSFVGLTRCRYVKIQINSVSDGTNAGGIYQATIFGKDVAGGVVGGIGLAWISFTATTTGGSPTTDDPNKTLSTTKLLAGKDGTNLDCLSRWSWDVGLPIYLIGDLGGNQAVGRLKVWPWKASQGETYTLAVDTQLDGSGTWTSRVASVTTSGAAIFTDIAWTPSGTPGPSARKVRVTINSDSPTLLSAGFWSLDCFSS